MQQTETSTPAFSATNSSHFVSDYAKAAGAVIGNFSSFSIFSPNKESVEKIQKQEDENLQIISKYIGKYRREDGEEKYTKAENNPLSPYVVPMEPLHILKIKDACQKLQYYYDRCAVRNMGSADQVCQDEFQATQKCLSKLKYYREEQVQTMSNFSKHLFFADSKRKLHYTTAETDRAHPNSVQMYKDYSEVEFMDSDEDFEKLFGKQKV